MSDAVSTMRGVCRLHHPARTANLSALWVDSAGGMDPKGESQLRLSKEFAESLDQRMGTRVFGAAAWQCWWCHRILPIAWVGARHDCQYTKGDIE